MRIELDRIGLLQGYRLASERLANGSQIRAPGPAGERALAVQARDDGLHLDGHSVDAKVLTGAHLDVGC